MNLPMIVYVVGCILEIEAALMLLPALIALCYGEASGWAFVICAVAAAILGAIPLIRKPKNKSLYAREGFVATALSWIVMSAVGALPFCITGQIPNYLDALFEMVSGFTTTGASILTNVEALDHCMLFWRSFSHWVGGMGVLVFMLAILPLVGGQNLHLMRAESPGPSVGKLVPKLRSTAIWLYGIYFAMTVVCFVLLLIGGMNPFESACLTFGTVGTGGFSIVSTNYASYTLFCKVVTTVFMLLCGMNFNFFYLLILRKFRDALGMEEVRWYYVIYFFAVGTMIWNLFGAGMLGTEATVLDVFFNVASVMTTTGYATSDFNLWPTYSRCVMVAIMFVGGCAGSTAGGVKVSRWVLYWKGICVELRRLAHPHRAPCAVGRETGGRWRDSQHIHISFGICDALCGVAADPVYGRLGSYHQLYRCGGHHQQHWPRSGNRWPHGQLCGIFAPEQNRVDAGHAGRPTGNIPPADFVPALHMEKI